LVWVSFLISYYLRYEVQFLRPVDEANASPFDPYIPYTIIFMVWVLLFYSSSKLYEDRRNRTLVNEWFIIANGASNAAVLVMALSFLLRPLVFSRLMIVQAAIIAVILLCGFRLLQRMHRNRLYRRGIGVEHVLVVGVGEVGRHVIRTVVARPDLGYRLEGFVDDDPLRGTRNLGRVPALGNLSDIEQIVHNHSIDLIILTLPWQEQRKILDIVENFDNQQVTVRTVPDLFQLSMSQVKVENMEIGRAHV